MSTNPETAHDAHECDHHSHEPKRHEQERAQFDTDKSVAGHEYSQVLPIAEEITRIDKRIVEKGRVRVRTQTELSEQLLRETLRSDAVGVTRVAVDRVIQDGEPAPQVRTEAGVTIIPVLEEVLVVEKRLILKEEVHIRQTTLGQDVEVPVTLHRQHATVERIRPDGTIISEPTTEE